MTIYGLILAIAITIAYIVIVFVFTIMSIKYNRKKKYIRIREVKEEQVRQYKMKCFMEKEY